MKRTEFLKYLKENNCSLKLEGHDHSWYENKSNEKQSRFHATRNYQT